MGSGAAHRAHNAVLCAAGEKLFSRKKKRRATARARSPLTTNLVARCRMRDRIVVEPREHYVHPSREPLEIGQESVPIPGRLAQLLAVDPAARDGILWRGLQGHSPVAESARGPGYPVAIDVATGWRSALDSVGEVPFHVWKDALAPQEGVEVLPVGDADSRRSRHHGRCRSHQIVRVL